jgi:polyisoprenoid-binding protein YceI
MKNFANYSRLAIVTAVLALFAPFALALSANWKLDSAHSSVQFSITHMGISHVHGHFGTVTGSINLNSADITKSDVNVVIDVTGLDTGNDARNNHLKTPDFFDTTKFTTATFSSTSVQKSGAGLTINGNLTLHGITKPVVLTVDTLGTAITSPMDHKQHSGFSATTTISRKDFAIGTTFPEAILSDAVKLEIEVEAIQQ